MSDTSADVPNKYDVIVNGHGYLFAPSDTGLPPSVFGVKNEFSFTPTFVQRQNVSGDFGDNQQDFFMTATQRDWSLGEQQRYFHQNDNDSTSRYWLGSNANVGLISGQVSMRKASASVTLGATPSSTFFADSTNVYYTTSTNLHQVNSSGTDTDAGAHGVGAAVTGWTWDAKFMYLTSESGTAVRKWDGGSFTAFSTTPAYKLAYLNNTLYGIRASSGTCDLIRYDTGGTATSLFSWKGAQGTAEGTKPFMLIPFGGKLLILTSLGTISNLVSLWVYDGTSPTKLMDFDDNFTIADDPCVSQGQVFFPGFIQDENQYYPAVMYYSNGSDGTLWKGNVPVSSKTAVSVQAWSGGAVITDPGNLSVLYWNPGTGGVSTIAAPAGNGNLVIRTASTWFLLIRQNTAAFRYPDTAVASSATITTSLFDFDSSLTKLFRGITVEFDSASDGNGGSVDISYRVGDVSGSYTSLQTGATSGTEYSLSGISGKSISVKVTLNKGTSTNGPVLKKIAVRAAPIEPVYKQFQYVLSLAGVNDRDPYEGSMGQLRDGTFNPLDGNQQAANLVTAITSSTPISCTDAVNGTMSSVFLDQSNCKISQVKPGEYIAVIVGREV